MDVVLAACAGLDVHKRTVVACRVVGSNRETRTFGTTTGELLKLSDWLAEAGVTHAGIERTGECWRPVHNILEGCLEVWLLNARHIKAVPGRKTDVADAEWIAQLMRHGLVRPSFIPPRERRDVRELTRHRTNFVRERATLIHRVQKVLEGTNIKLASVATDVLGLSGRDMLAAIAAGESDAAVLADLARGELRAKRAELEAALTGRVRPHHRFLLTELLVQIEAVEETIARFDAQIVALGEADEQAEVVRRRDTIPGVGRPTAEMPVAEIGTDMGRSPTAAHLASWAGLCPGSNESAGCPVGDAALGSDPAGQRLVAVGDGGGRPLGRPLGRPQPGDVVLCAVPTAQGQTRRQASHPGRRALDAGVRLPRHPAPRALPRVGAGRRRAAPARRPHADPATPRPRL